MSHLFLVLLFTRLRNIVFRHLELSDLAKEKLKSSVKIAKKLEKMEKSEESDSSEMTCLEYCTASSSSENFVEDKFDSIDALINGIINCERCFKDAEVQTTCTGDVVVMKVWGE